MVKTETFAAFKICIFGEGGVGKTSLTRRYMTGLFDANTKMTMGASIFVKYLDFEDEKVALQIWDFGGEEQYRFLLPVYSHGSSAAIFMYDITRYGTIQKADTWLSTFFEGLDPETRDVPVLTVGSKLDLSTDRGVPNEKAIKLSTELNMFDYIECSAKTGENVEQVFKLIVQEIFKRKGI